MASLYDLLGTSPDASDGDLQRAYHAAARQLHPDLNPDATAADAMRRLNDAWAVLGNPERRRRYDAGLGNSGVATTMGAAVSHPFEEHRDATLLDHPRSRLFRPSVLIVAVFAIIFVITAYAAPSRTLRSPATVPSSPTPLGVGSSPAASQGPLAAGRGTAVSNLVGECILPLMGYDAVVICRQSGAQLVTAVVASASECPAATTVYQLEGRRDLVCLAPKSP